MSTGRIILGVIGGAAIGLTLGVLLAPNEGKETRRKILGRSKDYADDLDDKLNDLMEMITEKFEMTKKEVIQMGEKAKEKVEKFDGAKASHNNK